MKLNFFLPLLALFFFSCASYHVPLESFKEQFKLNDTTTKTHLTYALKLKKITCLDSKGRLVDIKNEPAVDIKFTQFSGKKTSLFFRAIYVTDSTVCGFDERYIKTVYKCIPLNDIKSIRIRNSNKGFNNPNSRSGAVPY